MEGRDDPTPMPARKSIDEADATIGMLCSEWSEWLLSSLPHCVSCEERGEEFDGVGVEVPAFEGSCSMSRPEFRACVNKDDGFFGAVCKGVHFELWLCELPWEFLCARSCSDLTGSVGAAWCPDSEGGFDMGAHLSSALAICHFDSQI